jgi:hypothetical protein
MHISLGELQLWPHRRRNTAWAHCTCMNLLLTNAHSTWTPGLGALDSLDCLFLGDKFLFFCEIPYLLPSFVNKKIRIQNDVTQRAARLSIIHVCLALLSLGEAKQILLPYIHSVFLIREKNHKTPLEIF